MTDSGLRIRSCAVPCGDHAPAELARAGAEVDDVRGAPDGVLVVLDHDQRVALGLELLQRVEQDAVVARVQADGRLVEDVAHAAQVGAELRGEPDALRLAAGERRRRAVERQVGEADLVQEGEARLQLGDDVARDLGLAARSSSRPWNSASSSATGSAARSAIERPR